MASNRLTVAGLYRIARAASSDRSAQVTIATGPDGRRWAAWPYGCIELGDDLYRQLDIPFDGCYRMGRGGTLEQAACEPSFGPGLVVREMLPLLAATNRTPVTASGWFYEDGKLTRRFLERSDGEYAVVDATFWRLWTAAVDGPAWQIGSRNGLVVWAPSEAAPGVAGLLPVRAELMPALPELAGDAA